MEFIFMNLLVYLVYGRDKTFDIYQMNVRTLKIQVGLAPTFHIICYLVRLH